MFEHKIDSTQPTAMATVQCQILMLDADLFSGHNSRMQHGENVKQQEHSATKHGLDRNHLRTYFNALAAERDVWIKRNRYYNERLAAFYRFHIPEGSSVLEIGCATGYLLNALRPARGVGIDFSPNMIDKARENYPELTFMVGDAHDYELAENFDYIVISDTIGYFIDVQRVFQHLRRNCTPDTRLLMNNYNFMWDPILNLAALLRMTSKKPYNNWLSVSDVANLLMLESFHVVKTYQKMLFPRHMPLISAFFNLFLANLPLIKSLGLVNYFIARPMNLEPRRERSVSVVVAARNEKGNIEPLVQRLPAMGSGHELIFIEGGSEDGTYEEIQRVAEQYKDKTPISFARQDGVGKGDAVRKGFEMAGNDILMILDADLTVPPEDLPKFYEAIVSGKGEFINGSRLVYPMDNEAMRTLNLIGNKFFSIMFSWLLDQKFKDTLCGTKVITRNHYQTLKANRAYFGDFDPFGDYDLIFGASKMDLEIVELPIRYRQRIYGSTNIQRFKHGLLLLEMCFFAMRKIKFV